MWGLEGHWKSNLLNVNLLIRKRNHPPRADSRFWQLGAAGHVLDHLLRPLLAVWFPHDRGPLVNSSRRDDQRHAVSNRRAYPDARLPHLLELPTA